ncbi:MAG: PEP-CTERM sorting domain-containing protein [Phormidium sp.]
MKKTFSTIIGTSLLASTVAIASTSFTSANAVSLSFDTVNFTGDMLKVKYTLDDTAAGEGKIQFKVDVVTDSTYKNTADLRGIFFNIANDSFLSDLKVTGANVTTSVFGPAGEVQSVGNANLSGGGNTHKFDIGVEIGTNGMGKDDFQSTIFTLSSKSGQALSLDMFVNQEFGVRATSVGTPDSNRTESSKLAGFAPVSVNYSVPSTGGSTPSTGGSTPSTGGSTPSTGGGGPRKIPEPSTTLALGLVAISALKLRKHNSVAQA